MSMSDRKRLIDEPDLAAMMARLLPRLAEIEGPILAEAGLSMWEYVVLAALAPREVVSQVELSRRSRRDPTRLGKHLDDLAARGLIMRERAVDQRQRVVRLTPEGRAAYEKAKRGIRIAEDEFVRSLLPAEEAARLRRMLVRLVGSLQVEDQ